MAGPKKAERKPVSPLPATWLPDVLAGSPPPRASAASPVASPGPVAAVAGDVAFIRRVLAARAPAALAEVDAAHVVAGRGEAELVAWLARPIARTEVTDPLQAALDGLGTINALVGQISPTDRRAATFLTALSNLSKTVENIAKNRPREPTRNEVEERIAGRAVEVPDGSRFGRLEIGAGGRLLRFIEKDPNAAGTAWINGGIYAFTQPLLGCKRSGRFFG